MQVQTYELIKDVTKPPLYSVSIDMSATGHLVKKNNRPIWRGKVGKSKRLVMAEKLMLERIMDSDLPKDPINIPVHCVFCFYLPNFYTKKGLMSLTLGDLSNLYQLPEDMLQKAEVITNDALICSHDLSRKLPTDTGKHYLDIIIFKF